MNGFPCDVLVMDVQSLTEMQRRLGATLDEIGEQTVPSRFARPYRSHEAVRSGVGVTQHPWGVVTVAGDDRHTFLNDTLTMRVPTTESVGRYGFLLDPDGRIEVDLYVIDVGDRYLCLCAPGAAAELAPWLDERTFIQDVTVTDETDDHAVFGVHGPASTTKLTSVMPEGSPPETRLTVARGVVRDRGVTVLRLDAPVGEDGYVVLCRREDAPSVFDALVSLGAMATPFGYETWSALTLEAGTPLLATELAGRTPNVCGQLEWGVDLDKGCFVGQEVVARIANLGEPRERLVTVVGEALPAAGATVHTRNGRNGELTRRGYSPLLETNVGMASVPAETAVGSRVEVGPDSTQARIVSMPAVDGSAPSGRRPIYSPSEE